MQTIIGSKKFSRKFLNGNLKLELEAKLPP